MAEIAIISQDFCSLEDIQTQNEDRKIDYRSINPWVAVQYLLGPRSSIMTSYSYVYGFMRKVSPTETRTGTLKISKTAQYQSGLTVNYPEAVLDMDGNSPNRIINLADADQGGPPVGQQALPNVNYPQGTPHHAVNLRTGDKRYLRRESWSPNENRTMYNDLFFNNSGKIIATSNNGFLTLESGTGAYLSLQSGAQKADLVVPGGTIGIGSNIINNTANVKIVNTTPIIDNIATTINNTAATNNFTGDININAGDITSDGTKRIVNIRSYPTYSDVAGTNFDRDPISIRDFKRHQKGNNPAGADAATALMQGGSFNVYTTTINGVHQFRRITGGINIKLRLSGNDIIIDNTAPVGVTLDGTGLTAAGIVARLNAMFPPSKYPVGMQLHVVLDYPNSGSVGAITVVNGTITVTTGCSVSISSCSANSNATQATSTASVNSQPTYTVNRGSATIYTNSGSSWG
jgi:hypothetical protein